MEPRARALRARRRRLVALTSNTEDFVFFIMFHRLWTVKFGSTGGGGGSYMTQGESGGVNNWNRGRRTGGQVPCVACNAV